LLYHSIPQECIAGMSIQTASLSWRFTNDFVIR
jgi:hypothetical protein